MPNYRHIIHELNQRYKDAWDRAERLQDELDNVKQSRAYRLLTLWRRWSGRATSKDRDERHLPFDCENLDEQQATPAGTVSILIPFKDRVDLLRNCLRGLRHTTYPVHEILLLDNDSVCTRTRAYLDQVRGRCRVISCPGPFHFARICNRGAHQASGDFLLFLNNDIEVLTSDWLEKMLKIACIPAVGITGATLLYPDGTLQHAGIFPQQNGRWTHRYRGRSQNHPGEHGELRRPHTVPAVTGACLLIRRSLFVEMGGFNEAFDVTMNDVDLCERVRQRGYQVALSPHARLYHFESLSRGYSKDL